ncbi:hypothetical protein [uncultured Brevibacillus sp.]|uniref:hypothetical protein n=1 Tax=uncultured Brevibacillus sp. TaxID=169970 RepID=UPI00259462DC|nr:hypothetical protein [uncultured Brevibacillus sp.]
MYKALGFGVALLSLCIIIALASGNFDQAGNYTMYLALGVISLAGLMIFGSISAPSPYFQKDNAEDQNSRWRWILYFLLAAVPSVIFAFIYFTFVD